MSAQFFVIQVATGDEDRFIRRVENDPALGEKFVEQRFRLWWPRRKLYIRRRGKRLTTLKPLFPGYLFLETPDIPDWLFSGLRHTNGFVRFLKSNTDVRPLVEKDLELIRHFLSFGEVLRESKVTFDVNNRIVVNEGPLKGLEGKIVKVNRRKQRAKVKLDLYQEGFLIDLAFEVIQSAPKKNDKTEDDRKAPRNTSMGNAS